jgi:mannose-6-phosphate isomerase class I
MRYNKQPVVEVTQDSWTVVNGWAPICNRLNEVIADLPGRRKVVVVETYPGVLHDELMQNLRAGLSHALFFRSDDAMLPEERIAEMVYPDVTDDRIFGYLTRLTIEAWFDADKVARLRADLEVSGGVVIVYGTGAAWLCPDPDVMIYADMARWEIQLRMRRHQVDNLGLQNRDTPDWMLLYKQAFFVDWRVCDRLKKKLFDKWDFLLDTNIPGQPKMIEGAAVLEGLREASSRPFSVVPFFDPGPWGGQWMKERLGLEPSAPNYAWCFNCVPEENSLLLKYGVDVIEIPSINLVFRHPVQLLGDPVHARFGDEFPIRFDFLDTIDGGNLSLQVHPLTEYIQEKFGLHYTQDESYYLMDAKEGAEVYLGFREGVDRRAMIEDLEAAQRGERDFQASRYVQTWPAGKHDHFLIPAGTIHCSGADSMVLEISATPYIFTFKLWDWGRLGLDGKPRPINLEHGKNVLQWDRTANWVEKNLVNAVQTVAEGEGWVEERTGLHAREFIETRRHWFRVPVDHHTRGVVNVLCLVEGDEVVVESPEAAFEPFHVHYAEVFIVPASVGAYTIRPAVNASGRKYATIKAFVRH